MAENYGLPYTGSKSRIVHWVIDQLPRGRVWQTIVANDINGKYPQLFLDAVRALTVSSGQDADSCALSV